jgi:hypothetical protein
MMSFVSTLVTMFGIIKIFRTSSELQKYNSSVTINKRTLILHSILLTLQSLVNVFNVLILYNPFISSHSALISIVVTAVDLIVQLMICYICLTMGSHVHLR